MGKHKKDKKAVEQASHSSSSSAAGREPIPEPINIDEFLLTLIQEFYTPSSSSLSTKQSSSSSRSYSLFNLLGPLIPETDPTLSAAQAKQFAQPQVNSIQTQLYEEALETLFAGVKFSKQRGDYDLSDSYEVDLMNLEGIAVSQFDKSEQKLIMKIFEHWVGMKKMPKRFKVR